MSEPTRLLTTPESELERALLDAGRSYTAPSSMRSKTLLALGLTAAATTSTSVAAASSTATKATGAKVAIALLVIGAAAIPIWRYLSHPNSAQLAVPAGNPAPVLQTPPEVVPPEVVPPEVVSPGAVPPEAAPPETVESAEVPAPHVAPSPGTARTEPKPASAPPLAAEIAALDAARTSLSRSEPKAALVALDAYARNFPRGKLRSEAEVLRIGALAKSGQTDAARKRAETFLRHHPDSVLASRVRSYVGL
jgi:hypothetical protein